VESLFGSTRDKNPFNQHGELGTLQKEQQALTGLDFERNNHLGGGDTHFRPGFHAKLQFFHFEFSIEKITHLDLDFGQKYKRIKNYEFRI
jgi:hypothetical protein